MLNGVRKMKIKSVSEKTIAVIYGGKSCEHEISVITACLAKGYFRGRVLSVYFDRDNRAFLVGNDWTPARHVREKLTAPVVFLNGESAIGVLKRGRLTKLHVDAAVNCCHGLNGEDGCIAALCRMSLIPLVGSDVESSAVAMDKILTKTVLRQYGFPTVRGKDVSALGEEDILRVAKDMRFPLIVKPALLGSSIGVGVAHSQKELLSALQTAFKYCPKVLMEEALTDFTELNCAAMRVDGKVETSNVDRPLTANELLTFRDKYIENNAQNSAHTDVSEDVRKEVSRLTAEIYIKLGFGGVIRVDYLYDNATSKLYVNEINSTPGSLAFGLWEGRYSRTRYGEALVDQAVADYRELQSYTYTFESGVLNGACGVKKK